MDLNDQQNILDLLQAVVGTVTIDSNLTDQYGGNVLHIIDEDPNSLIVSLTNTGPKPIDIAAITSPPSSTSYDLSIEFPDNPVSFGTLPSVVSPAGWQVATDHMKPDVPNNFIYLTTNKDVSLQSGETLKIVLSYKEARIQDSTVDKIPARINFSQHITSNNVPLLGQKPIDLFTTAGEQRATPLHAEIIGPSAILTGGQSPTDQYITVRISNPTPEPVLFEPPDGSSSKSSSAIQISADVNPASPYALYDPGSVSGVALEVVGATPGVWDIVSDSALGQWTVTTEYKKMQQIDRFSVIDLKIGPIQSTQAPGLTNLEVQFINFKIYGTQAKVVSVEKSPLVSNPKTGGGVLLYGTAGKNEALAIQADSSAALLSMTQQGNAGSGLKITVPMTSTNTASGMQVGPALKTDSALSAGGNPVLVNSWLSVDDAETDLSKAQSNLNLHNDDTTNGNTAQISFSTRDLKDNKNVFSAGIKAVFNSRSSSNAGAPADLMFMTSDANGAPATRLFIGANGNVGVGNENTLSALQVGPALKSNTSLYRNQKSVSVNTWLTINEANPGGDDTPACLNLHNESDSPARATWLTFSSPNIFSHQNTISAGIAALYRTVDVGSTGSPADLGLFVTDDDGAFYETIRVTKEGVVIGDMDLPAEPSEPVLVLNKKNAGDVGPVLKLLNTAGTEGSAAAAAIDFNLSNTPDSGARIFAISARSTNSCDLALQTRLPSPSGDPPGPFASRIYIDSDNGYVGIGDVGYPEYSLDVGGDVRGNHFVTNSIQIGGVTLDEDMLASLAKLAKASQ